MSLIQRAMSRAKWNGPWSPDGLTIPTNGQLGSLGYAYAGTDSSAMSLAVVYSCVRLIAGIVSGIPMVAYDQHGKVLDDQPDIVANPFGGQTDLSPLLLARREGIRQVLVSLLLRGNAYLQVMERDPDGRITLLNVLHPDRVSIDTTGDNPVYQLDGADVPFNSIVHVRGLTMPGDIKGMSPIGYARRTIELGLSAEEFGAQFFRRGASLSGVLEVPGDLTTEQARQIKANFEAAHVGVGNALGMAVLSGGAKFAPVTVSPEDAQFLGTQAAKTLDIAMLYGVPPHMIGQTDRTTSWGKGIEEQTRGFIAYTVKNWTDPLEDIWTRMTGLGISVRFDFTELLRPDISARTTNYQLQRLAGIRTINEIRADEGWDPVEGGDDIMAPLNSSHAMDPGWQLGEIDDDPHNENGMTTPGNAQSPTGDEPSPPSSAAKQKPNPVVAKAPAAPAAKPKRAL